MKLKLVFVGVISFLAAFDSARGGEIPAAIQPMSSGYHLKPVCDCFDQGSTSIDLFGAYIMPHSTGDGGRDIDGSLGGGLALTKYNNSLLGFSTGVYWWDDGDSAVTSATASLLLRYPIRSVCVAPYAVMGFGGNFGSVSQFTGHLGAGLEIRVPRVKNLGLFVEGTYTWADATENYAMFRLGTRYTF